MKVQRLTDHEEIRRQEVNSTFIERMARAMITSYFKYGPVYTNYKTDPPLLDAVANIKTRLEKFESTGNTDFLVDVANFAMIAATYPCHPNWHYIATDTGACDTVGQGVYEMLREIGEE
jgi:hypothetical protein